jgi:acyl-homoserine lactone acylase PvdQ
MTGRSRRRHRGRATALLAGVLVVSLSAAACTVAPPPTTVAPASDRPEPPPPADDPATISRSVLPPGNGNLSGPTSLHLDDQRAMYDRLDDAVADGTLTDDRLGEFFKDAGLGTTPSVRTDRPAPGVTIDWDRFGVPRVQGDTAEQVAWGAGWAVADARLLIAEIGRLLGRAGTIEMGGTDILGALQQIGRLPQVNYTDAELEAGLAEAVADAGPEGPRMLAALDAFVAGLNAWLDTHTFPREVLDLGIQWRHWNRADVLAVGIVVDDIFGAGGGDEVGNAAALATLQAQLGEVMGRATFDDLRDADEPDATSHTDRSFPYPLFAPPGGAPTADNVVDPAAVALPDDPATLAVAASPSPTMSNYLAVTGERSATGRPILVGGPQSSYFAPELLFEMELRGGGYDARGITFPGLGPWVVIGRGRDHAWTATAGGSDLADQRVERLCEPDGTAPTERSRHYVHRGACVAMTRPDAQPMTAWRTVHGPVAGTTTVAGAPVAISRERMSRFRTAHAAPAFWALNRGLIDGVEDFAPTMSSIPMSFNWVYVDAEHVATFHSGWYPIRAPGVDPDLPSWGTGEWDWRGRLDWRDQPRSIDPASGYAVSWNNHVAPGWREPDNDWSAGVVQRVDLLDDRAAGLRRATPADVVAAVQDTATVDVRGALVLPTVLDLLEQAPAPNERARAARDELQRWATSGAHRRDRNDDGWYDDHAVALMDALFPRMVDAVFRPRLGDYLRPGLIRPKAVDNAPSQTGGAYAYGWYSTLVVDLERAAGERPTPRDVPVFCGDGTTTACAQLLWRTLDSAQAAAGPFLGFAGLQRLRFLPYVGNLESMRWSNRPTFQQVVSFG